MGDELSLLSFIKGGSFFLVKESLLSFFGTLSVELKKDRVMLLAAT